MQLQNETLAQQQKPAAATAAGGKMAFSQACSVQDHADLTFKIECLTTQNNFLNTEIVELSLRHEQNTEASAKKLAAM
jgi:hypothetical protein